MAGRPRKQARTVLDFENRIMDLDVDLCVATPKMYRDRCDLHKSPYDPNDPLSTAWNVAGEAVLAANAKLANLGDLLRARAGITEPGPSNNGRTNRDNPPEDMAWRRSIPNPPKPAQRIGYAVDADDLLEHLEHKKCSALETVQWVSRNIELARLDANGLDAKECPGFDAWNMLKWVIQAPKNEDNFWTQIYPKAFMGKTQMERDKGMTEDDRDVDELEAAFLKGLEKEVA